MKKLILLGLLISKVALATFFGDPVITKSGGLGVDASAATGVCSFSAGSVSFLSASSLTATLSNFVGDSGAGGTKGLVPAPAAGDAAALKFLMANGSWAVPAGSSSGTVTSVSVVSANGLAGTVATATTTPAITLSTTITGLLKGNGTAISAASSGTDYQAALSTSAAVSNQFLTAFTAPNTFSRAQPAFTDISGSVAASQMPALTGDVTTSAGAVATTIANDAVTNAKMANMATATFKGRTTAGTGDPEDLTATQATAMLNAVVGDSGSGGTKGLVPAPGAGDAAAGKFLKADGTFAVPAGGAGSTSYKFRTTCGQGFGDANTQVLLDFEDASTVYDYGINSQPAWSLNASAVTSTTQAKFGSRSLDASAGLGGANTPSTSSNILGNGAFTVEFWLYTGSSVRGNSYGIAGNDASGSNNWGIGTSGNNLRWFASGSSILSNNWTSSTSNASWVHVAFVRNSGTLTEYINGTSIGSVSDSTNYSSTTNPIYFGYHPVENANLGGGGFIDEVRISNSARYTANFTSPSSAFTITNTISYDPNSVLSSVTAGASPGLCTLVTSGISTEAVCQMHPVTTSVNSVCNPTSSGSTSPAFKCTLNGAAANVTAVGTCQ